MAIEIKKRNTEEVACWKVVVDEVAPNTVIETDGNVTVLVKVDGAARVQTQSSSTVFALFNPGKNTKLFGGNKPYKKVEIYAIDQSSEFNAEWALAGNNALTTIDPDFNVEANVIITGNYYYRVDNFFNFITALPMNEQGEITRNDIREFLRQESTGVFKSVLAPVLAKSTLFDSKANADEYIEEIKEIINKKLDAKGMSVYNIVINKIAYTPEHERDRERLKKAKIENAVGAVENEGKRDDISVDKDQAIVDNIRKRGVMLGEDQPKAKGEEKAKPTVVCPRCGEKQPEGNYCTKCGEKLKK